ILGVLAVSANLVAEAANRSNESTVVTGIDLAAEIVDVNVDDVRHSVKIELPDLLDDGGAGNRLAFMAHQEFQQSEFLRAEINVVTSAPHGMTDAIDFEVLNLENRARRPASSAQHGADARGEFHKGKRLRNIIIRAGVETADALLHHAGAGHNYYR